VRCLDFRGLAEQASDFDLDLERPKISDTFAKLTSKLPKLRCMLLDDHSEVDLNPLSRSNKSPSLAPLLLLSVRGCRHILDADFFSNQYLRFRNLVYLDISDIPEISANKSVLMSLRLEVLPRLRILKAQGQNMGDTVAGFLLNAFEQQLWSLELSRNGLTDDFLRHIRTAYPRECLRDFDNHSTTRFAVEGSLKGFQSSYRNTTHTTVFVGESEWSATFSHPDRYFVDAPTYGSIPNHRTAARLDGRGPIMDDSVDAIKEAFVTHGQYSTGNNTSMAENIDDLDICQAKNGVTHLRLNGNNVSSSGVISIVEQYGGQFECFECDSMTFPTPEDFDASFLPPGIKLAGILGAAHIFRPVFSSNLQVLRIHHSLVTQLLSIETDHLSAPAITMVKSWVAERYLLPRAEHTFPQAFVPDMNPRLRSLMLTRIPRRSTGPLIDKIINFLKLASIQERVIQETKAATRHGPQTLPGLRHIGLEFEHDPSQELYELENGDSADQFSFFEENGWGSSSDAVSSPTNRLRPSIVANTQTQESARLQDMPPGMQEGSDEYISRTFSHRTVSVWIGAGTHDFHKNRAAVNDYMRLARNEELQYQIKPATPCHVAAGVPSGSFIFGAAWDAMMRLDEPMRKPRTEQLTRMLDVLAEIKNYRARTRAAYTYAQRTTQPGTRVLLGEPHFHWTGELKVSRMDSAGYYTHSKFWR